MQDLVGNLTEEERRNLPEQAESLNFSQAAIVLQNSSNVYSRKVEYLYNLVLQVHEDLIQGSNSGTKPNSASSRKASVDAQIEDFHNFDPHVEFLLLDDYLPLADHGKRINLQQDHGSSEASLKDGGAGLSFATVGSATRLSLGATTFGVTHFERSGAGAAAAHHVMHGTSLNNNNNTGSLRLIDGKCDVADDGTLILPGAGRTSDQKIRHSSLFGNMSSPAGRRESIGVSQQQEQNNSFAMDDYDGGDDDGAGFAFGGDDDDGGGPNGLHKANMEGLTNQQGQSQSQATQKQGTTSQGEQDNAALVQDDPWALLDAHSTTFVKSREHKFGTTCRLPAWLDGLPSEGRKRGRRGVPPKIRERRVKPATESLAVQSFKAKLMAQRRRRKILESTSNNPGLLDLDSDIPQIPLKGLIFGDEFLYIAKETARIKRSQAKAMAKLNKHVKVDNKTNLYDHDERYAAADYGGEDDYDDGDDDDGFAFAGGDNNDDDEDITRIGNTGVGNLGDMFPTSYTDTAGVGPIDTEGKTFEELCRAHIQAFAKGAEAYATETHLSKRVGDWHDNLVPILEEEERRPEFDIYNYTQRVIATCQRELELVDDDENDLSGDKFIIDFGTVTKECERFDVCRMFLSVLSLSNAGNIKLHHGDFQDGLAVQLLHADIDRPMETFLAPSAMDEN